MGYQEEAVDITTANGVVCTEGVGVLTLATPDAVSVDIEYHYLPSLPHDTALLSVNQLLGTYRDATLTGNADDGYALHLPSAGGVLRAVCEEGVLPRLNVTPIRPEASPSISAVLVTPTAPVMSLHLRLGHAGRAAMQSVAAAGHAPGVAPEDIPKEPIDCEGCMRGQFKALPRT
eukprot:361691-Chlamydomonas_euryale.AAC.1